jgi:hypothetical protein
MAHNVTDTAASSTRNRTLSYWIMSRAWRGKAGSEAPCYTTAELLEDINTVGVFTRTPKLLTRLGELRDAVIFGKRCRKTKALTNIVPISRGLEIRAAKLARQSARQARASKSLTQHTSSHLELQA